MAEDHDDNTKLVPEITFNEFKQHLEVDTKRERSPMSPFLMAHSPNLDNSYSMLGVDKKFTSNVSSGRSSNIGRFPVLNKQHGAGHCTNCANMKAENEQLVKETKKIRAEKAEFIKKEALCQQQI